MNEVTQSAKDTVMKTMAVIGFVAVLIFGVWLAVKIVGIIPGAFSSLASIADGVYNNRPVSELTIANSETILNDGESFTISWTDLNQPGSYTFRYECTDGVAVDIRNDSGAIVAIDCDTPVNVGVTNNTIELTVQSERKRFVDVNYTITFMPEAGTETISQTSSFTMVNANIPQSADLADGTEDTGDEVTETETNVTQTPSQPTTVSTPIYAIPQSDPNGYVDLAVSFVSFGTLDSNNRFTTTTAFDNDVRAAFRFTVVNTGTKTSDDWKYTARLTSDTNYVSNTQAPLKPNERAIITLGFDAVGETGVRFVGVDVSGGNDRNTSNNDFLRAVQVTN